MDFSQIVSHPDREEIISKLVIGESPRNINQWLKIKYSKSDETHLHLSTNLLQNYKNTHLNLMDQLQQDVQAVKVDSDAELSEALKNNKTYQERIVAIADNELDLKKMVQEIVVIIRARTEQVFDSIQQNPGRIGRNEHSLIRWCETLLNAIERCNKIVNEAPDQIVQHNYTVQYVDQTISHFQQAFKETLSEIDYDLSLTIMDKFTKKVQALKEPKAEKITLEERLLEAEYLETMSHQLKDSDD